MSEQSIHIPHRCPVCCGNGLVPPGFYLVPVGQTFVTTNSSPEQCRSCSGSGIIWNEAIVVEANINKTND